MSMKPKTCAYCINHIWHDERGVHVCVVDPEHPQEMSCAGDCRKFKNAGRFNVGGDKI